MPADFNKRAACPVSIALKRADAMAADNHRPAFVSRPEPLPVRSVSGNRTDGYVRDTGQGQVEMAGTQYLNGGVDITFRCADIKKVRFLFSETEFLPSRIHWGKKSFSIE